jgi:hypothetical protein
MASIFAARMARSGAGFWSSVLAVVSANWGRVAASPISWSSMVAMPRSASFASL